MSNKVKGGGKVPKLRFPEFRDAAAWEEKKLDDACEVNPPAKRLPERFVYIDLESVEAGVLLKKTIIGIDNAPSRAQRPLKSGDVLFQMVRPYQKNNYLFWPEGEFSYVASTGYAQLRAHQSATFLFHYLHTDAFVDKVMAKATGSNYPAINSGDLSKLTVTTPNQPEQQKIADCLSSIDEVIVAQAQKLDALKVHRNSLMQQLFPAENETMPKLRFPEFRDAGKWESTTLSQLVDFQSGSTPFKGNPAYWNGSIPWVSAKDMKKLFLDDSEDHITTAAVDDGAKQVPAVTVLMLTRGMTLLKDVPICILSRPMSFNQDVKALQPKEDFDGRFLAYLLLGSRQRLLSLVDISGHGTGRLDTDELKALDVMLPKPAEQQLIAACLSSIDDLITAQTQKIEALKAHKKGLMQQLFPAAGEAQG